MYRPLPHKCTGFVFSNSFRFLSHFTFVPIFHINKLEYIYFILKKFLGQWYSQLFYVSRYYMMPLCCENGWCEFLWVVMSVVVGLMCILCFKEPLCFCIDKSKMFKLLLLSIFMVKLTFLFMVNSFLFI